MLRPFLSPAFTEFARSIDFFPVIRSRDARVRSSEDLLDPGTGGGVAEVRPLWVARVSAEGRRMNEDGGRFVGEGVWAFCRLVLRTRWWSSPREIDFTRDTPLIDEEPRCEDLNARACASICS